MVQASAMTRQIRAHNAVTVEPPAEAECRGKDWSATTKFAGLVVLMLAARYAPVEGAGSAIWSLVIGPQAPSAVVTGSVEDDATGGSAAAGVPALPRTGDISERASARIRMILAEQRAGGPEAGGGGGPRREAGEGGERGSAPPPKRARSVQDEGDGEIFMGGTGLLDSAETTDKEHALAAANPNDYLVICEAGCRPQSDKIVYKVSKAAAASLAIAQRRLELSAASPQQVASADSAVVCVAGCYDDAPVASKRKRADAQQSGTSEPATRTAAAGANSAATVDTDDAAREMQSAVLAVLEAEVRRNNRKAKLRALEPAPASAAATAKVLTAEVSKKRDASADLVMAASAEASAMIAFQAPKRLAEVHLLSTEGRGHRAAKRVKALTSYGQRWRTVVTRVSQPVPGSPAPVARRMAAWKEAAIGEFETTVSIESSWDVAERSEP